MCGDLAGFVVKTLNAHRCNWPWRERIVTGDGLRSILGLLAMDEDEVTEWIEDRRQRVSIMDALIEGGYVYLDPRSAREPYGPLCRSCELEVSPAELGWAGTAGESDCARCANPIPGSSGGVSIYVW